MTEFTGSWNVRIHTPIGVQRVRLDIRDDGGALAGTATQGDETVPFEEVRMEGETLRWRQSVTRPMKLDIKFDVRRVGDSLEGKAKAGIFPAAKLEGERVPS